MVTRTKKFSVGVGLALIVGMAIFAASPAWAESPEEQQGTVDKALATFEAFIAKKARFRDNVKDAKALLIVPTLIKAGIILGGSGGSGVLVAWNESAEEWSQPAFYSVRSVGFGLQVGGEAAEVIMIIWTQHALDALYRNMFKVGGDASVAAGPLGVGTQWEVSGDVLSFAKCRGLFAGLHYDGSMVRVDDDSNKAYYGKAVNSGDIIMKNAVSNPGSAKLREVLRRAVR
jgi:lipid-binding SYLF domain-containing protein